MEDITICKNEVASCLLRRASPYGTRFFLCGEVNILRNRVIMCYSGSAMTKKFERDDNNGYDSRAVIV